ncbi:MAG: GGDEF domain-containing phosphodiesterase [Oscillospiraceae bacterium]|nr:GGDEF domain-containing phosphodiesterase [Oscillospiraceae bacterium]
MEFIDILERFQCVGIRLELSKNLPLTIDKKYTEGFVNTISSFESADVSESFTFTLAELVNSEDLNQLLVEIEAISSNAANQSRSNSLRSTCRFLPDNRPCLVCCDFKCETLIGDDGSSKKNDYLFGTIMDVSQYHESNKSDPVRQETLKREAEKFSHSEMGIAEIVGLEQLMKIQLPLSKYTGLYSAILSQNGGFICSATPDQQMFDLKAFEFSEASHIKINRKVSAIWVIASNEHILIEKCKPIHEALAEILSRVANSSVMLYNEMTNTDHSNKLLSEAMEQNMLLNSIYQKVLNEENTERTMQNIVAMTGEFLGLDRIVVCEAHPENKTYTPSYDWVSEENYDAQPIWTFDYTDEAELLRELEQFNTYFSCNTERRLLGIDFTSYVASILKGNERTLGLVIYTVNEPERILSHAEKRLLRSISQIIATVIMRWKDNLELEESKRHLFRLANFDSRLLIKNQNALEADVFKELSERRPGCIVIFKVPGIKDFDNFVGIQHGDGLIMKMLGEIGGYGRVTVECYVYSGRKIAVLLRNVSQSMAKIFCESLIERYKQPWSINGKDYYFEIMAGAVTFPDYGETTEELFRKATMALRKAEEIGINSYAFFEDTFEEIEAHDYACTQILRNAVENDMEGLIVKYIPVYSTVEPDTVDVTNKKVIAYEAAISLSQPEFMPTTHFGVTPFNSQSNMNLSSKQGLPSSPNRDFSLYPSYVLMKMAEKMGADVQINQWLIKQSCEFCRAMRNQQPTQNSELMVCVSVTSRFLASNEVSSVARKALDESGLSPDGLMLSFSERVIARNYERFIVTLSKIKKHGIFASIDNIGGYYSLASLLRHSVIRSASADVTVFTGKISELDSNYVNSIIELAKSNEIKLGITSVQNDEQLKIAKDFGANWYQGKNCSNAMTAEEAFDTSGG